MKNLNFKNRWLQLVIGILLAIVGITVIVINIVNPGVINEAISWLIAISLFSIGLLVIINTLITSRSMIFLPAYVYGSLLIALGVLFVTFGKDIIQNGIPVFIGTLVVSIGVVTLVKAILLTTYKAKVNIIVVMYIAAVLLITAGILVLIFTSQVSQFINYALGALVLVYGILQIVYAASKK
ncbi:MAG: DUF308 domain-containing protein [Bacilli bacterium]